MSCLQSYLGTMNRHKTLVLACMNTTSYRLGLPMSASTILIYCRTMRYTRQVTPYSTVRFIARIMAEIIYTFLCLNGLTKVGMISMVEERTMLQTMYQFIMCKRGSRHHRKPTKTTSHILLTRSLPQEGRYSEGQEYHKAE